MWLVIEEHSIHLHLNQGIRLLDPHTYWVHFPAAAKTSMCIIPLLAFISLRKKAAEAGGDRLFCTFRDSGEQNCGAHNPLSPLYENSTC